MDLCTFYKELLIAKEYSSSYIKELGDWHFYYSNPLFWIFLTLLFFLSLFFWRAKKSFSFCFAIGVTLLLSTRVDSLTSAMLFGYPTVRMIMICVLIFTIMYYIFIKKDDL